MMTLAKWGGGVVLSLALVFSFLPANRACAATRVFVEEYTYQASEADSKLSSRAIALEQVKRLLLEKLGTYLESETEVKNFRMTKDQITVLTAGIVRTEIIDEKWDGRTYVLKARIEADPDGVTGSIEKLRHDRQKTKELQEARKTADEALKEIEKLKKELELAKAGKPDLGPYNEAVNRLRAADWLMTGYAYSSRAEAEGAIYEHAERTLKRMKNLYEAGAATRGMVEEAQAHAEIARAQREEARQRAVEAYTSAIALIPTYAEAYYNRGLVYDKLGNQNRAVEDQKTAAKLGYKPAQDFLNSKGIGR